jgi:chromosome segregation ATPase
MLFLADTLNFLGVGLFIFVCFVLAGTIWLFLTSMDNLKKIQEEQRLQYSHLLNTMPPQKARPSLLQRIKRKLRKRPAKPLSMQRAATFTPDIQASLSSTDLFSVKQMLDQQQQINQKLLTQLGQLQGGPSLEEQQTAKSWKQKVEALELALAQRDAEIENLVAEQRVTEKIVSRFEQMQQDFVFMQNRMKTLEQQASQAGKLSIALEDNEAERQQLLQELNRKSEKVQQVLLENTSLHQQIAELEDQLQETNFQRQQLFKKAKMLEEVNTELSSVTDANKKMQSELRRIGELESMLNMITEERNQLLRR